MARERKTYEVYEIYKLVFKPTEHFKVGRETWELKEYASTWGEAQKWVAEHNGTYKIRHRRIKKHETIRQTN